MNSTPKFARHPRESGDPAKQTMPAAAGRLLPQPPTHARFPPPREWRKGGASA